MSHVLSAVQLPQSPKWRRITEFGYDWRGRLVYTFGEEDDNGNITYAKQTYDNLDRVVVQERFLLTVNTGTATPVGQERLAVLQNNLADDILLARSELFYDMRGRVWKTEQSVVNPVTGAVNGKLLGQSWYDAKGRVLKQIDLGANAFTKYVYDSLGRVTKTYYATNPSESGYAAASSLTSNTVFTQSEVTYDNRGNVILSSQIERLSTATGTGALTLSTGRQQVTAMWYDAMGRQIASANYGMNGGVALTRPATVPARSDTVLVTETKYDALTGRAFQTIDPAGKDHRVYFDALGRSTKTVANFTGTGVVSSSTPDQNVTVEMAYHTSGQLSSLTAKNPVTGDQVTRYVYGTAKAWIAPLIHRNDMLVAEIYPDSDDFESGNILQNGPDGIVDRVEFQYNRAGEAVWKRDQNGTVHSYEFDNLGRLLHDRVTTLAAGIDGAVRRISTVYDTAGNVKSITSYDNVTVGSGTVVNQVLYEYDTNGLLAKDYSNPSGSVSVSTTPYIAYTYDTTASGGYFTRRLRPVTMKYPGGKTLTYVYGVANSSDDLLSRYTAIKDGASDVVQYIDNGVSTPVKVTYPQPGLTLDYTASGTLDNFGRITDHAWKKGSTDVARIKHDYDRIGNRLHREDTVGTNFSEVYAYDGVNQLIDMQRGVINSTKNGVTTKKAAEQFGFDATGNWGTYKQDTTGAGFTLNQSRTHNKANEIVTIAGANTYVASDLNGNMTKLPKPDNWSAAFTCVFDAWNRLVQVKDGATVVATYSYNGLNHRVKKVVGGITTISVFNQDWQELELATGGITTVYVWGLRYIDDLVCRDKGEERLYCLADPNWNVVALANTSGTILERIAYNAFGKTNWLDASFGAKAVSGYAWNRTFTGQVLDDETNLMLYRNRFYHLTLGRFVTRDPIGYDSEDNNIYRYVTSNPQSYFDPYGEKSPKEIQDEIKKWLEAQKGCYSFTYSYSKLKFSRVEVEGGNSNQRSQAKRILTAEHTLKTIEAWSIPKNEFHDCPDGYECKNKVKVNESKNGVEALIYDETTIWRGITKLRFKVYYKGKETKTGWKGKCKKCSDSSEVGDD